MGATWRQELIRTTALAGVLLFGTLAPGAAAAQAQVYEFNIPEKPLADALRDYGRRSGRQLLFDEKLVAGRTSDGLDGTLDADTALARLLAGTDLTWTTTRTGVVVVVRKTSNGPPAEAAAPQATAADQVLDELVVTGTNLRGVAAIGPVTQLGHEDIERSGYLDVGQALRSVTANFGGGLNPETNIGGVVSDYAPNNSTHASSANLLGLGSGSTLVLLNGHRLPVVGNGVAVDLSLVPVAAIDRIDVKADGASAVYGADAVAGVVNIITRTHYDGAEARLRYGGAKGGLETRQGSFLMGGTAGDFDGLIGVEGLAQSKLKTEKRAATRRADQPYTIFGDTSRVSYFAAGGYDLTADLRLQADAVYMQRSESGEVQTSVPSQRIDRPSRKVSQFAVSGQLLAKLGETWTADFAATATETTSKIRSATSSRLTGAPTQASQSRHEHKLTSIDGRLSGDLTDLPAGPVSVALGASWREERSHIRSRLDTAAGVLLSRTDTSPKRRVSSLYAEANVPLFEDDAGGSAFRLNIAGRYDDYSDVGEVAVPKLGLEWVISPELTVSTSLSRSFRAPSPFESSIGYGAFIGDSADAAGGGRTRILYLQGPGRELSPERSRNLTINLAYQPDWAAGLNLTASYYNIRYTDRIANPDPTSAFAFDMGLAPTDLVTRDPGQALVNQLIAGASVSTTFDTGPFDPANVRAIVDARNTNIATTRTEGLQGGAEYSRPLFGGDLDLSASVTYVIALTDKLTANAPAVERAGRIYSPAKWRTRLEGQWSRGGAGVAVAWNRVDDYVDNRIAKAPPPVSDWNTIDASLSYDLGDHGLAAGTRVILSAQNLFDAAPPRIAPGFQRFQWDGANASIIGRFVSLELVQRW